VHLLVHLDIIRHCWAERHIAPQLENKYGHRGVPPSHDRLHDHTPASIPFFTFRQSSVTMLPCWSLNLWGFL